MPKIIAEMPVRIRCDFSIAELIALAGFAEIDDYIRTIREEANEDGETVAIAKFVHYWQTSGTDGSQAMQDMKYDMGLRPATYRELLELIVQYPEQPVQGGIVALGTQWELHPDYCESPTIWRKDGSKVLHRDMTRGNWRSTAIFLAFDVEPEE